jgi:hypothetical protein
MVNVSAGRAVRRRVRRTPKIALSASVARWARAILRSPAAGSGVRFTCVSRIDRARDYGAAPLRRVVTVSFIVAVAA